MIEISKEIMGNFPWPTENINKHTRGRLAVFSGGLFTTGAARLAARAASKIGAGWVKLFADFDAAKIIAAHETGIMVGVINSGLPADITTFDAAIIGPAFGFGDDKEEILFALLSRNFPVIIDADALHIIRSRKIDYFELIKTRIAPTILTPHEGEFKMLFGEGVGEGDLDKAQLTQIAANQLQAIIIHKGAQTVIAAPDSEVKYGPVSTPWLATQGTGDVLAGIIGGLVAQGVESQLASQMGVYIHTSLGHLIGPALIAEEMADRLGEFLNYFAPENLRAKPLP